MKHQHPRLLQAALRVETLASVLALLIIPALLVEARTQRPDWLATLNVFDWVVWLVFSAEFALFFAVRPGWETVRERWLDLAIIVVSPPVLAPPVLQGARSIRVVRLVRLARVLRVGFVATRILRDVRRSLGHRKFHFVALVAVGLVVLGAIGLFLVEGDRNPAVGSFGDALWWAIVTATTVGYGDVSPVSTEGRAIAVVLMIAGIGVIGVFTATMASFFLEHERAEPANDVSARLEAIERKLDQLIARNDGRKG